MVSLFVFPAVGRQFETEAIRNSALPGFGIKILRPAFLTLLRTNRNTTAQYLGTRTPAQVEKHSALYLSIVQQRQALARQLGQRDPPALSLTDMYNALGLGQHWVQDQVCETSAVFSAPLCNARTSPPLLTSSAEKEHFWDSDCGD